jgi:hypothetical protein
MMKISKPFIIRDLEVITVTDPSARGRLRSVLFKQGGGFQPLALRLARIRCDVP